MRSWLRSLARAPPASMSEAATASAMARANFLRSTVPPGQSGNVSISSTRHRPLRDAAQASVGGVLVAAGRFVAAVAGRVLARGLLVVSPAVAAVVVVRLDYR